MVIFIRDEVNAPKNASMPFYRASFEGGAGPCFTLKNGRANTKMDSLYKYSVLLLRVKPIPNTF